MTSTVHFTSLREYAIPSIEELTPGEEIVMVYPQMIVCGRKNHYTDDGIEETDAGTTVQSHFSKAKFVCRGFSDNISPHYTGLNEEESFTYLPISERTEIKTDQKSSYSAFNLIESPTALSIHTNNFIVRAKDIEDLDVDWTIFAPVPYYANVDFWETY